MGEHQYPPFSGHGRCTAKDQLSASKVAVENPGMAASSHVLLQLAWVVDKR